jgi:hypothetical protein
MVSHVVHHGGAFPHTFNSGKGGLILRFLSCLPGFQSIQFLLHRCMP